MTFHLIADKAAVPDDCHGAVVVIGNLDGMHRGHQKLVELAREEAQKRNVKIGVVTFEPHPRTVFRPDEPIFRLTPPVLKARLAEALGCDFVVSVPFDRDLSSLEPEDFVRIYLVEWLRAAHVVSGYDFHFGKGRKGNPDTMRQLGKEYGFGVSIIDQVSDDDGQAPFSSSAVRAALRHGHMDTAANQLGYRWTVIGAVVKGDQRGRTIGFPTANICLEPGAEPAQGIYAVRVRCGDEPHVYAGAGYIGTRPTFDTQQVFLEVFIFDFEGDIYGAELSVEFISYIRGDHKFDNVDDLVRQMTRDCATAQATVTALKGENPMSRFPLGRWQMAEN